MPKIKTQSPAKRRTQPHAIPNFLETLSIADSLAQKFVGTFPSKEESPSLRGLLQCYAVPGLRWLWRTGDADTKTTLAVRVAVWRDRSKEEVKALGERIRSREILRVEGGAL